MRHASSSVSSSFSAPGRRSRSCAQPATTRRLGDGNWPSAFAVATSRSTAPPPTRSVAPAGRVRDRDAAARQLRLGTARRPRPRPRSSDRARRRLRGRTHRNLLTVPARSRLLRPERSRRRRAARWTARPPASRSTKPSSVAHSRPSASSPGSGTTAFHPSICSLPRSPIVTDSASFTTTATTTCSPRKPIWTSTACGSLRSARSEPGRPCHNPRGHVPLVPPHPRSSDGSEHVTAPVHAVSITFT
jgi:hypothetical protein